MLRKCKLLVISLSWDRNKATQFILGDLNPIAGAVVD
jgi:hypothetical protein